MAEVLGKENFDKLEQVINRYRQEKGPLMPVMQAAQNIFGYLPIQVQNYIAQQLDVPMTEVYGVATFYSQFCLEPRGEHTVSVCLGTACYVKGAQAIMDRLVETLGVEAGKTTGNNKFTLVGTRCLGCCGLAPVMMIDDDVYGTLVADQVPGILAKY